VAVSEHFGTEQNGQHGHFLIRREVENTTLLRLRTAFGFQRDSPTMTTMELQLRYLRWQRKYKPVLLVFYKRSPL